MGRLKDRSIIVTGAAQGIGAVYAAALAAEDALVTVCDVLDTADVVRRITDAGGRAIGLTCDVVDASAVERLVAKACEAFGTVHGLINNAALFASIRPRPFEQFASDEFDRVMQVNVRGTFECIKAVAPHMRRQKYGKIVNIASGTAHKGVPMLLPYVASKGAVIALTRSLARELGRDGICVNAISPGLTASEAVSGNREFYPDSAVQANVASRALPREQVPEDLTGAAVFLMSGESDFMTGQTVVVDGGSAMV